jgi:exonuclease III
MVPSRTSAPLIRIRGRSQNAERGLCPSGKSGSKDKARTVHHYIDHDGVDFVCVQESGVRSDTCPPALSSVFSRSGHHLIVSGAHSVNSFDTVAIAVHKQWKIARVFRLPASSRCLAVEIRQGSCTVFVASILLPPKLDQIPVTTDDLAHRHQG